MFLETDHQEGLATEKRMNTGPLIWAGYSQTVKTPINR